MATRYWVGGTGTWDASSTANWSASSGGGSGASAPTSADDAVFDGSSGGGTVSTSGGAGAINCKSLTFTSGFTGTFVYSSGTLNIYGSITLGASTTYQLSNTINCVATTTGNTITSNGKAFGYLGNGGVTFNGAGGEWILQDSFNASGVTITLTQGTLRTNGASVTTKTFNLSGSSTRAIYLGASTITISGASPSWNASTTTNLTFDAGTSSVVFDANTSTVATFNGGSLTYNLITSQYYIYIYGSNVINTLTASAAGIILYFEVGTVTSVTNWSVGSTASVLSLRLITGSGQYEIEKLGGGTVTASGLDIQNCLAYPASTWTAVNSVDSGNNTNWTFTAAPSSGAFFALL